MDILQNLQYTVENSSSLVNIILCLIINFASGSSLFGIGKYINANTSLLRIIYNLLSSTISSFIISLGFVKLQSTLHKYLLPGSGHRHTLQNDIDDSDSDSEKNIHQLLLKWLTMPIILAVNQRKNKYAN